jgi:MFS family permease
MPGRLSMLARFSLYGFLKNQRYFEPFLYLALIEKGMTFTQIGALVGLRELMINLLGVPMGAVADVLGRRRSMIFSFAAYVVSFVVLGLVDSFWALAAGMGVFAVGESFRSGTHKAMIFDWLAREGRPEDKTRVYGYTRSWSKRGSAVSVIIASGLVLLTDRYTDVFLLCAVPYALGIVNFLGYPAYLEGASTKGAPLREIGSALWRGFRDALRIRPLRRLLAESTVFEGTFKVVKGYLQPLLESLALALPLLVTLGDRRRTAVLVGAVYVVLHVLGSRASRGADAVAVRAGSQDRAAGWLWAGNLGVFAAMAGGLALGMPELAAAGFVVLAVLQDTWRPLMITRIDDHAPADIQATILSIESQGQSLFAAILAPLIGIAVDALSGDTRFLPVAGLGVVASAGILLLRRRRPAEG